MEETEKHEIWFKAKLLGVDEVFQSVTKYLECACEGVVKNIEDKSNVGSATTCSTKSHSSTGSARSNGSNKSSIAMARAQAEAKRAALLAHADSQKKRHERETQAESLCKKMEQMDREAESEAAGAEVSVLQAFSAEQDGMESYFEKHELKQTNVKSNAGFKELTENKTCICVKSGKKWERG